MSMLERAIGLAVEVHHGQRDKADKPYILHPLRLMLQCETEELQIVAVLHDVIEDSSTTPDNLRELGFSDEVIDALACLTKRKGEDYCAFIERAKANPLARRVKELDLIDNMDASRLTKLTESDSLRIRKYICALSQLRSCV
jgi:(p)ppGpp synthase/HD superfamily hydrolase